MTMDSTSETLATARVLIAAQPDLARTVEELHQHFSGEPLHACDEERIPGIVLRWLHCYADLELWHEALHARPAPPDIEFALDLAAQLEELGIEPDGECGCHRCEYRGRC
ncbi:MAG: hypothetical protein COW56_13425 [Rhodocyclales bacterium CG17_big_fil_post_rev_8_21_14_2_50_68_7]|nr:MAG: hypothetical protein AUK49_06640 [Betaproteobacteria bacterium CG2_30_68_42]PIV71693.1 MAG: hypothetical protein COW56_13425 [Rhodocyclales bacterium CG17_big_fil_post_rev_8_21_14_2_50_68_7]